MDLPQKKLINLCKKYQINLMIIFGSFVTENFNHKSDIDLAILATNINLIKDNRVLILKKLENLFKHREIDLILLNHADPLLKFNIATEGKMIYEKEAGIYNEFLVRAMNEHNDAKKFYKLDKKYINDFLKRSENNGQQRVSPPKVK